MSAMYISTNHGNVKASHFFKLQRKVPFSVYGLVRAGHKGHSVRVRKRSYFGVERLVLLPQRNCPKVSLKISNGVTLKTVVTGFSAPHLAVGPPPCPPPPDVKI